MNEDMTRAATDEALARLEQEWRDKSISACLRFSPTSANSIWTTPCNTCGRTAAAHIWSEVAEALRALRRAGSQSSGG